MKTIAHKTHSIYFETIDKTKMAGLYERIREIIDNQYVITYVSKTRNAKIDVGVKIGENAGDMRSAEIPEDVQAQIKEMKKREDIIKKTRR